MKELGLKHGLTDDCQDPLLDSLGENHRIKDVIFLWCSRPHVWDYHHMCFYLLEGSIESWNWGKDISKKSSFHIHIWKPRFLYILGTKQRCFS